MTNFHTHTHKYIDRKNIKTHRNFNEIPINFILVVDKINSLLASFGVIYKYIFGFSCRWCAFGLIYVNVRWSQKIERKSPPSPPLSNLHTKLMNANNFLFYISSVAIDWKSGIQFIRNLLLSLFFLVSSLFVECFYTEHIFILFIYLFWRTVLRNSNGRSVFCCCC